MLYGMLKAQCTLALHLLFIFPPVQMIRAQQTGLQPGVKIEPSSQPAVDILGPLTKTIRECPEVLEFETTWGKRPTDLMRVYMGAPTNVTWGVDESKTPVRSPYTGYIEFSVSRYYWIPPAARGRFDRAGLETASRISGHFGELWFRYEYDIGPIGAEFSRSFMKGSTHGAPALDVWTDNPQSGQKLWEDAPKNLCWDRAARHPAELKRTNVK